MENEIKTSPPKTRAELGLLVSKRIQLVGVSVIEGFFRRNQGIEEVNPRIRQRRSAEAYVDETDLKVRVVTRLVLNAFPDASESENSFMEIEARFLSTYTIDSMEGLQKEHFDAFAEYNGIFNVWPYWREFVQSMTVRMGLPALTVPVFRITLPKTGEKKEPLSSGTKAHRLMAGEDAEKA